MNRSVKAGDTVYVHGQQATVVNPTPGEWKSHRSGETLVQLANGQRVPISDSNIKRDR